VLLGLAGPAFEGAGSPAACARPTARSSGSPWPQLPGRVLLGDRRRQAGGLCGSGIIDTVAEMLRIGGCLERSGTFSTERGMAGPGGRGRMEFVLVSADQTATGRISS